jgi:hypothetical protein
MPAGTRPPEILRSINRALSQGVRASAAPRKFHFSWLFSGCFGPQIRRFRTVTFGPNSHQISSLSEFQSAGFVPVSVQFLVAVLMAVRLRFTCILVQRIARITIAEGVRPLPAPKYPGKSLEGSAHKFPVDICPQNFTQPSRDRLKKRLDFGPKR